jgi:uncharacterized repeat protein (TIGR01451 family)
MKSPIKWVFTKCEALARLTLPCAALLVFVTAPAGAAELQKLRGHVPAAVAHLAPVGQLPGSQRLNLAIGLPLRNQEALTNLLHDLYDPTSPKYRQYLTTEQFTEQFGPTKEHYQAVIDFAAAHGLTVVAKHPNRVVLDVSGSVADLQKALHITMRVYQHPTEARKFYAPDAEPSLDLAVAVLHISGLDDYALPFPKLHKASSNGMTNLTPKLGSGPGGNYMGYDFRTAYIPGTSLTGTGQAVGLLEFDGYYTNDVSQYLSLAALPSVPLQNVYINGFNGVPGPGNGEVTLDIDMAIAMAPGLNQVIVYMAPNPSPWVDLLSRMANDNLAKQLSCSWGGGPPEPVAELIFLQMAAQGQSFYDAIGDSDAFTGPIPFPGESPNITQVGGTTLSTSGPLGSWVSEKVWNWGGGAGTCGGVSTTYSIPVWQQGIDMSINQGSTTMRNMPDVALTADNIFIIADNGISEPGTGGTSAAAPLWAGFTALANQQAVVAGMPPVGFVNPALYTIGKGPIFTSCFHDTVIGDNTWAGSPDRYFAVPGYDLCTGWGTPMGTNLINALLSPTAQPVFTVVSNYVFGGNGNGVIEYNECNSLNLILANVGNADATGISATLSSTTPGVAIAQATSPYPDLPSGALGTDLVPFKVSTSPSFICGTPIEFSLLVECAQVVTVYKFSLPSGMPGNPLRFDNNSLVGIPSPGSVSSSIAVSNINFALNKVTVSLFVQESFDYFLSLELIAPDGTTCTLTANNGLIGQDYGSACGSDSQRTTFDDAALMPIASGSAPFVGSFQPTQPLSIFAGKSGTNANGIWQLRASDQGQFDLAAIQCWSLFITPTLCTDGGGQCPGADMALGMTAQPSPFIVGKNLTYNIAVTNLGPSVTKNVIITHVLPDSVTLVSASGSQGTYAQQGNVITFSLGPMVVGARATLSSTVQPNVAGEIYSTATASSDQPDFNPDNNSATVAIQVTPATADLTVGIAAVPNPVLIGGTLTYTVSVTNNGPSPATSIGVTNALPLSAQIQSTTVSGGTVSTIGNVVLWSVSRLDMGASATATITVTPTAEGIITAIATVGATEFDPVTANNTASVSTTVGPAADLAISLSAFPNPVVAGSNVTYTIAVTNAGPSLATGVAVSGLLPAAVNVLSTNATQGSISISNSFFTWSLGALTNGASASLSIVAKTTANGTLSTTATVLATQADPNPTNNTATTTTIVAAPFISIVPAGAVLTKESGPTNGAIDLGETVTMVFYLRNAGNVSTSNLVATLLATPGVVPVPPNSPQTYGSLLPSSLPVGSNFTFTATGANGGTISPTLQLQDGTNTYPPVSFTFALPVTQVSANTNIILIPDPSVPDPPYPVGSGPATPYPSTINVSNFTGVLGKVTVTLSNFNHSFPSDVNVLLVAPSGAKTLVMSHAGDQYQSTAGLNLTFDDSAPAGPLPETGQLASGVWQPVAYTDKFPIPVFPTNAPAGPYPVTLSALNGLNPNGSWSLFVFDDSPGDTGAISNGWSLTLSSITPVNKLADLGLTAVAAPSPALVGGTLTYTFAITNGGPNAATFVTFTNVLPVGATLVSAGASQGTALTSPASVIVNLGTLNAGAIATVTNVVTITTTALPPGVTNGTVTSAANVAAFENDLNPVNNSVSVVTAVTRPVADLGLTQTVAPDPVVVGYSLTNTIVITNRGPSTASGVVLTEPLPPGVGFIAASSSTTVGTITANNSAVTCALGDLASNATATILIVLFDSAPGLMTNTVSLSAGSYDPSPADNSSTYVATVVNPAPQIVNAGAVLTYESGPVNGVIDAGETVTLSLALANTGSLDTSDLTATLLPAGGVITPSGPQDYGVLVYGGPSTARSFTFKAASDLDGGVVATLQLKDGASDLGTVAFSFGSGVATNGFNSAAVTIPDHGMGNPYPSTINVSGVIGRVSNVTLGLNGLTHSFPHDVNVLLVSPSGSNVLVMSHTGGAYGVTNLDLVFDDAATVSLPNYGLITNGTYKPSSYEGPVALPGTAPASSYQSALSGMVWSNPNGAWSLYVFDDKVGDSGYILNGWSLNLITRLTVGPVIDLAVRMTVPASLNAGSPLTNNITIANFGPDTATGVVLSNTMPSGVQFVSASLSQGNLTSTGGGQVTCNLGSLAAGASANVTIVTMPSLAGSLLNSVNVTANEEDLVPANNSAQATTTVTVPATLSGSFSGGYFQLTVTGQPNTPYVVQASTNLTSWVSLSTNTSATGTFTFIDTATPAPQLRFYRTLRP